MIDGGRVAWRRRAKAVTGCAALAAGLLGPVGVASAAPAAHRTVGVPAAVHPAAAASCPKAPKAPPADKYYKLLGVRWNPSHTIRYSVDTDHLARSQVRTRVADVEKAMRAASALSGLPVAYAGTESKAKSPAFETVQFEYTTSGSLASTNPYILTVNGADTDQLYAGVVDVRSDTATGYGRFSSTHVPEGHELLFVAAGILGLAPVSGTDRQVMNPDVSAAHFEESYQGGDKRGLYEVGSVKGCGGFHK
jgi:hypothetical protein